MGKKKQHHNNQVEEGRPVMPSVREKLCVDPADLAFSLASGPAGRQGCWEQHAGGGGN